MLLYTKECFTQKPTVYASFLTGHDGLSRIICASQDGCGVLGGAICLPLISRSVALSTLVPWTVI